MQTIEVHHTVADLAGEWDELSGGVAFAGHRWLRLVEAVRPDLQPRYLVVRRGGRIVAAAAGAIGHRLRNPRLESTVGPLLRRWPALHIGNPVTGTSGLLAPDDELGALVGYLKKQRLMFCLIDQLPLADPVWGVRSGYQPLAWLPVARLDLNAGSFEQFLTGLVRKKRQEIRRVQRHAEREGIVVKPLAVTEEHGPHLDRLVANVLDRHRESFRFAPGLFPKAAAVLGDDLTVLGTYRDGRIVGCVALMRDRDEVTAKWFGRDYEHTAGTSAYHALVTGCVSTAIGLGARRLHLGAAAPETKNQFGVEWEPRGRLVASRSRAVNWCFGQLRRLRGTHC